MLIRLSLSVVVALLGVFFSPGNCDTPETFSVKYGAGQNSDLKFLFLNSTKVEGKHPSDLTNGSGTHGVAPVNKTAKATGRQYMISGASGWGWPGYTSGNLDLYSLLAGIGFLGLLSALFMYFSNRTATITVVNASGRRRRRDLSDADEELLGETLSDYLNKLALTFNIPWWDRNKRQFTPFKLN